MARAPVSYGTFAFGHLPFAAENIGVSNQYSLLIGGVDFSSYLEQDTWSVTGNFGRQGTTAHFQLLDDFTETYNTNTPTAHFHIAPASEVLFTDTVSGQTLFAGYCFAPNIITFTPGLTEWGLDCIDYTTRADNIIVLGEFYGETADQAILKLFSSGGAAPSTITAAAEADGGYIAPGPTLGKLQLAYTTLSQALMRISRLASQSTDYSWYVDQNRNLHFISLAQSPPPTLTLSDNQAAFGNDGSNISATFGTFDATPNNFTYVWDGSVIRNSCIVRGANVNKPVVDSWRGTGSTRQWLLSYVIDSEVSQPILKINGVQFKPNPTVISQGSQTVGNGYEITQNAAGMWVLNAMGTVPTPGSGALIELSYTASQPIVTKQDNAASQAAYADSKGPMVLQSFISDQTLTSLSAAIGRGQGELQEYQWVQERVQLITNENWPGHINPGDTFTLYASRVPDSQNNWQLGVLGTFLAIQVTINGKQGNFRTYSITGTRIA